MVCNPPVRPTDATRPRIDFAVIEVDSRCQFRKFGLRLVGLLRPGADIGVTSLIAKLGDNNRLLEAHHPVIARLRPFDEGRCASQFQHIVGFVAEHRQADYVDIAVARIIGLQPLLPFGDHIYLARGNDLRQTLTTC